MPVLVGDREVGVPVTAWDDIRRRTDLVERLRGTKHTIQEASYDMREAAARIAELERIVADVAAVHPQNGYSCMWCRVEMNNHELPPDTYRHESSCVWLRAVSAVGGAPGVSETHTDPANAAKSKETL